MARDFRPRGIGVVLDDAIALYRANWRALLTLTLLVLAPVSIAYSITSTFYLRAIFESFGEVVTGAAASSATPPQLDPAIPVFAVIVSSVGALWWLVRVYFTATIFANAGPLLEGRTLTVRAMLKAGLPAFVPLFVIELVVSFIVGAAGIPTLYIGSAVAGVLLAMAGPVVVIEGGIGAALGRSYALVKRHFWRVALLVSGAYVISTQFESALASPVVVREIIFGAQNMSVLTSRIAWGWKVFDGTLQGVAMALVLPFLQLCFLLCYLDLRAREEGMDLVIRARALREAR
jgi:hypothetical protein